MFKLITTLLNLTMFLTSREAKKQFEKSESLETAKERYIEKQDKKISTAQQSAIVADNLLNKLNKI